MFYATGDFILGCSHGGKTMQERIEEIDKLQEEQSKEFQVRHEIVSEEGDGLVVFAEDFAPEM